jgi:hypothetical protein
LLRSMKGFVFPIALARRPLRYLSTLCRPLTQQYGRTHVTRAGGFVVQRLGERGRVLV